MTTPTSGPSPQGGPQQAPQQPNRRAGHEFFQWLRQLGLRRGTNRWVGGVCSGIARRLGWDPLLVRIIWFALCFVGGAGVALYGIAWLMLPDERDGSILVEEITFGHVTPGFILSVLMILSGVTGSTATIPVFGVGLIVTIALIIAAVALLSSQARWGQTWEEGWRYDEASHQYVRDPHYQDAGANGANTDASSPSSSEQPPSDSVRDANPFAQQYQSPAQSFTQPLAQPWNTHTPPSPAAPAAPKYYETRKPAAPAIVSVIYGLLFLTAAAAACLTFLVPTATGYTGAQWFGLWVLVADVIVGLSMIILGIAGRRVGSIAWMIAPLLVISIFALPPVAANINKGHTGTISTATVMTSQSYTADDFDTLTSGTAVVMSNVDIDLTDWSTSTAASDSGSGSSKECPTGELPIRSTMSSVTIELPKGCGWSTSNFSNMGSTIDSDYEGASPDLSQGGMLTITGYTAFSSIEIDQE